MRIATTLPALLCVCSIQFLLPSSVLAHHSRANFNRDNPVEMTGTVTNYKWLNPHVYVDLELADGEIWVLEGHNLPGAMRAGWTENTLTAGDQVRVGVTVDRNPDRKFALMAWVLTPDKKLLGVFNNRNLPDIEGAEIVQVESTGNAIPSKDFSGTWRASVNNFPLFEPPLQWPLTELGRQQASNYDQNDDPLNRCIMRGIPRTIFAVSSSKWERLDSHIRITKDLDNTVRTVWLDGRDQPGDWQPDRFGFSVGKVQGNALIVETQGFSPDKWGSAAGLDSSDKKIVTERYELSQDGLEMAVSYTISDPIYLTESATVSGNYRMVPDHIFADIDCSIESSTMHLLFK